MLNLWDEITDKDFEDDSMALLVEVVGLEIAKKIVSALGGDNLYVPKVESVLRLARNRRIYKEFTGFNHKELSTKYNLTTRHIRKIIEIIEQQQGISHRRKEDPQMTLF
ncbi:MAG: hypothetical protein KKC20_01050 [Proteobacteria bacterium]|nr:hypothetical protein [Pseudomonadota bacterium]